MKSISRACLGLEDGLKNKTFAAITPRRGEAFQRFDRPAAIFLVTQQGSKTGVGIEAGETQPIHRTFAADDRRRPAIADHRIIFDPQAHQNP
jgi:hypothetical protein